MPADDHVRLFLTRFEHEIRRATEQILDDDGPPNIFKARYTELLETARACGELDDYQGSYYVDPATGILAARLALRLPRHG